MKANIITGLGLAMSLGLGAAHDAGACTSLIASPGATVPGEGSIITYAADSHTLYGELYRQPAADHPAGAMRRVVDWDSGTFRGEIPEVAHNRQHERARPHNRRKHMGRAPRA